MNRLLRFGSAALTGAALVVAGSAPASAAAPTRSCPSERWILGFVDEESGSLLQFDKNGDTFICALPIGPRPGLNVIDNKVRRPM